MAFFYEYVPGFVTGVTFQPVGLSTPVILSVESHTWSEEIKRFETTATVDGGVVSRIGGNLDGKGTVKASLDLLRTPYVVPKIWAGVRGRLNFFFGQFSFNTGLFSVPCIITTVHYAAESQGKSVWSFDVEMNSRVGAYFYPLFG